jgi:hypothetical protein
MPPFDPTAFGPAVAPLLAGDRLPELGPGQPNLAAKPLLQSLTVETLFPSDATDPEMARACLAGLWLLHDFLDESHAISQEIDTPTGSFFHGILHRREPDYGNAKYWFRRIGPHPVLPIIADAAAECGFDPKTWSPIAFVDLCERHYGSGSEAELALRHVQRREWQLLFAWCWRSASSG